MTTYTEQFAGMTTGIDPTNFTERFGTTTGYSVENPADGEAEDDRVLSQDATSSVGMWSFDDIDGDANRDNCDMIARFRVEADGANEFLMWARASGSSGNRTGYFVYWSGTLGAKTGKYVAESFTAGATGMNLDTDITSPWWQHTTDIPNFSNYPENIWLWIRFRVNGVGADVQVNAKVWADGQPEPDLWTSEYTDSTAGRITAAGWCGVQRGTFSGTDLWELDYFSVGTNGDTPAIATAADNPVVRITQSQIAVAVTEGDPPIRITGCAISAAVNETQPVVRVTGSYKQVLFSYTSPVSPQSGPVLVTNS